MSPSPNQGGEAREEKNIYISSFSLPLLRRHGERLSILRANRRQMEAMERLTADDIRKLNVAQTNALCHWLHIPYGQKEGSTMEKREQVWRTIVEKKVKLPSQPCLAGDFGAYARGNNAHV